MCFEHGCLIFANDACIDLRRLLYVANACMFVFGFAQQIATTLL